MGYVGFGDEEKEYRDVFDAASPDEQNIRSSLDVTANDYKLPQARDHPTNHTVTLVMHSEYLNGECPKRRTLSLTFRQVSHQFRLCKIIEPRPPNTS